MINKNCLQQSIAEKRLKLPHKKSKNIKLLQQYSKIFPKRHIFEENFYKINNKTKKILL